MAKNTAQILITCSEPFKEALGEYAQKNNVSVAWVIREATARMIGYSFSEEESIVDGRKKYNSVEERKEAQKQRAKEQKVMVNKLLELYKAEERKQMIEAMEESLRRKAAKNGK